ncbi:Peroxisomal acyl-coenzyme A oxidase 1 [Fonsecaea pedrosoi]|nr:Peroxisomal acyl-coenzyme A oxidase 1 [Fonsecaea pedrosoi]
MSNKPDWVKALKPAGPPGTEILAAERKSSPIDVDGLAAFLFTQPILDRNHRILEILQAEPVFDKSSNYFRGRTERIKAALARGKRLQQLTELHGWSAEEYQVAYDLIGEPTPYGLHAGMFMVTLREQGTPEQHRLFLEKAQKYEMIGCYAQTELGHGSNVRGLETTATWNPHRKTFTLHSPSLTSSKWWIGSLGRTANHAVVIAQLIIDKVSYGPHPFVVQIRDLQTHQPLDNIYVGDIGPKFGFNTMDNGFLLLNNVEIPHDNMLSRFSRVDALTNKYIRPSNPSLVYGTLTWVRSNIVLRSGAVLARGVTTAVRYCAVRKQFRRLDAASNGTSDTTEMAVLNYSMVQYRLLPLLAATFALHFTGQNMIQLYQANQAAMNGPDRSKSNADILLAELHASSCALKAYTSTVAGEGLETCRRACGGHGYSSFAGVGSLYADYLPTLTWEGDNFMLTQQVSRYLLKIARQVVSEVDVNSSTHAAPGNQFSIHTATILANYRTKQSDTTVVPFDVLGDDTSCLVDAFAWRVAYQTFEILRRHDDEGASWDSLLVSFWRLSTAYSQYLVVRNFHQVLSHPTAQISPPPASDTMAVLHSLFRLNALYCLSNESSEFLTSGACTAKVLHMLREERLLPLLSEVRPHAVKLVDAWKISDWQLDSSLGRADGRVYEDLFYRASENNPLNDIIFDPSPNSTTLFKTRSSRGPSSKL